jgi:hypothetical protein
VIKERQGTTIIAEAAELAKKYRKISACVAVSAVNVFQGTTDSVRTALEPLRTET